MESENFIPTILSRVACKTHKALVGIPCFHVSSKLIEGYYAGVCNTRARSAGFVGQIQPTSLSLKQRQKKR